MNCQFVVFCVCAIVSCVSGTSRSHTLVQRSDDKIVPALGEKASTSTQDDSPIEKRTDTIEDGLKVLGVSEHHTMKADHSTVNSTSTTATTILVQTDGFWHALNATGPKWLDSIESGALQRTGLVVLGVMSVLVTFFIIRAVRIRQRKSKSRKYGVITSAVSDMEMEPLERAVDDDEEETTLFDAQQKFRRDKEAEQFILNLR